MPKADAGIQARAFCPKQNPAIAPMIRTGGLQTRSDLILVLCQPCSDVFRADLLPRGLAVGGGGGEAVPGDVDGGGA